MGKRITEDEVKEVLRMLGDGQSDSEIFTATRLSLTSIRKIAEGKVKGVAVVDDCEPSLACEEHAEVGCIKCRADRYRATGGLEHPENSEPDDPEMQRRIASMTAEFRRQTPRRKYGENPGEYQVPVITTETIPGLTFYTDGEW